MKLYKHAKLQEAFDLFVEQQNALLPNEETVATVTLSENFKERMRKMLSRQKCGFFVLFGTVGRRVASIMIAILVTATVATISVEALREPVVQFFTEVFEKFTQVFFVDDTPDTPQVAMEKRAPSYIPEGYVMDKEDDFSYVYRITYIHSETGEKIRYNQQWKESGLMVTDTENTQHSPIMVGDHQGIMYNNKGTLSIVYSDDQYTYTLTAPLSLDELLIIAKSIEKI